MLDIIGQFLTTLLGIIPRLVIIRTTHQGVRFKCGKTAKAMKPGLHWYWPVTTQIEILPVARQTNSLPSQVLMTKDGQTIVVAGSVVYTVNDMLLAYGSLNYDVNLTLDDVARSALVEIVAKTTLADLQAGIIGEFTKLCRRRLKQYGIGVHKAYLTDLCPCRVYRLVGNLPAT
jgi:regulator of protease activity HflC (stomatin/prohibitin superfamily)